ncbi:MAG: hypothetical protein JWQ48_3999 [Conexibacter sp.]|jgi:ammonium transporter, Amt family|nr:hypothetical protein [Conexibacter sp.]
MDLAAVFTKQIGPDVLLQDVFYALPGISLIVIMLGLALIDGGLVRAKNALDSYVQKFVAAAVAGIAFLGIGYAIWNWQFNAAFGVPSPLKAAIDGWWIGGSLLTHLPQAVDPAASPNLDVYQVFMAFFIGYVMIAGIFIASSGVERLKPLPLVIMSAIVGGLLIPIGTYLTWGPVGPLSNLGVHDFSGVFSLYIFIGTWSLIMSWRLRPRLGTFVAHPRTVGPVPQNLTGVAVGVLVMMIGIPAAMLGCGFLFPGTFGFVGISGTTSGIGLVFVNVFVTFVSGIAGGAVLSYRTKNPFWVLLGPLAGYIAGGTLFDVAAPWKTLIVTFFAPFTVYGVYKLLQRRGLDDLKVAPLTLGPGIYGALVSGFVAWNVKTGGYPGITSGKYAFQHAHITPWWQLVGIGSAIALAAIPALILCFVFARTGSLRVSETAELEGLDHAYWNLPSVPEPGVPVAPSAGNGDAVLGGAGTVSSIPGETR